MDSFQVTVGGHAQIAGLSEKPETPGDDPPIDPMLSINLAGAIYKPSLDNIPLEQRPADGEDLPIVFELRTGSLNLEPDAATQLLLKTGTVTDGGGLELDDVHEVLGDWQNLVRGGPGDLGIVQQPTTLQDLTLRDAADWFRFETLQHGTATSYVQIDFARERGDLDVELFRLGTNPVTGEAQLIPVRSDGLAFGDRARVSLLGQPAGQYFVRVSDDAGGRSPYYTLTVRPPQLVESGITADIHGFELRDTGLVVTVDTDLNFDARLEGRLLVPFSLQEGVPTELGFQAQINNAGLYANVFTEIGNDAVMVRRKAVPATGAISVDIDPTKGGLVIFDYQAVDQFKFAGLEVTSQGPRWVIGQFDVIDVVDGETGEVSQQSQWTWLKDSPAVGLPGGPLTMQVRWNGVHVEVGTGTGAGFVAKQSHDFPGGFRGGMAGLGSAQSSAWFANYRVWASGETANSYVEVVHDPLLEAPASPWRVERGAWQPDANGLVGKPTEIRLGDWLLVAHAKLDATLRVEFDAENILAPPVSIDAGIAISDVDALVYEVEDGGTPLDPDDPNSPQGLAVVRGGFGSFSTDGLVLGAEFVSAGIKDVVFFALTDVTIDLAGGPNLLTAGGGAVTIPFFDDEPLTTISGSPAFGITKPVIVNNQVETPAKPFLGDNVTISFKPGALYDEFSLRDLLPMTIEQVHLTFPDTDQLDTFNIKVDARFNLYELDGNGDPTNVRRGIFAALPFDPILAIGRPASSGCTASPVMNWPELDPQQYPDIQGLTLCDNGFVSVEVAVESLLSPNRQMTFKDLGPIFIGAQEFPVLGMQNVVAGGVIYLGKIVDGQWNGDLAATFTVRDTTQGSNSAVTATAIGALDVMPGTSDGQPYVDTRLQMDWIVEASVNTPVLDITDGYVQIRTELTNRADQTGPFHLSFDAEIGSFDTGLVEIPLGDYFTLFGRAAINAGAGPDEPYFILRQAGVRIEDAAPDTIKGLTLEAGGFGVSADLGRYFVMAPEPQDDPSTPGVDETVGAYFRVAIDEHSDAPGANIFGLPEWFPLQVTEIGIRFKGSGDGDDFDVTVDQLLDNPLTQFQELANPDDYNLIISGGLQSSDLFPLRAQVKHLEIVLADLRTFVENGCYGTSTDWGKASCPVPFVLDSVQGVSIGMEPLELGPMTVGGLLSLGVQDVELSDGEHQKVLYGQIVGDLGVSDVGIGAELIITQYGPILARIRSGVPVPIGGIVGAAVGSIFPGLGTAAGFQIGNQTGFVITGLEGSLVFDGPTVDEIPNPLDILDRPEFARPKNLSAQEIEQAITRIVRSNENEPVYTWNNGFRLVGSGVLTNTNIYNTVGGRVTLGVNVGYDSAALEDLAQSRAQVFLRGDLEILGQSLAQASAVFDASDPLNPTFNVAAGIPGSGGLLSFLLPMQARIGAQLDTDGLAAGTALAARTFLETVFQEGIDYFDRSMTALADRYETQRIEYLQELQRLGSELTRLEQLRNLDAGSSAYNPLITAAEAAIVRARAVRFLQSVAGCERKPTAPGRRTWRRAGDDRHA